MPIRAVLGLAAAPAVRFFAFGFASVLAASAFAQAADDPLPFGLISEASYSARMANEVFPIWATSGPSPRAERGTFKGVGGQELAYARVNVPGELAAVVIVTGRTENLLKYQEVVADFVRQKYSVYVYDHRGQGFSERLLKDEPEKGHVEKFDHYVDDLQTFVQDVVRKAGHKQLVVLAHSMGGGVATRHLQRFPGVFSAAALSSPMHQPNAKIFLSTQTSCAWFETFILFGGSAWPAGIERPYSHGPYDESSNEYTHSPARWAQVLKVESESPTVRLGGPTRRWVSEACSASDLMLAETSNVVTPVLVLQASGDTAVMPEAQMKFCAELARTTGRQCEGGGPQIIQGARHELLIEADRYRVPAMSKILGFYAKTLAAN